MERRGKSAYRVDLQHRHGVNRGIYGMRHRSVFRSAVVPIMCAVLLYAVTANVSAQNPLDTFVAQLQRASHDNDRIAIAAMIRYPLVISIGGGIRIPIADAPTFLARYDDIFTAELRDAIARRSDAVVIQRVDGEPRITSIVVPERAEGADAPASMSVEAKSSGVRKPDTRRIAIRVGPRPTQIPGTLSRDSIDTFVLYLPKGKLASVRLERVPSGAAAIRVVHVRTGAALSGRVSADARFVSGRPTEDGDYRIEVRRVGSDDGHLPYMLSLSLR
jgi:hypothetical protein